MYSKVFQGDVEDLRLIAEAWKAESNGNGFGLMMDADYYLADLKNLVEGEESDLLVLYDDNGIIGYMGITTFQSPLGRQKLANEHYWFVLPDKRGFGSLRLLNFAKQWAKDNGCSHLIMNASNVASDMHDKMCRLYEELGMKKFETSYIKEI
jgi:GNAT superfamily N-acetyltransferase